MSSSSGVARAIDIDTLYEIQYDLKFYKLCETKGYDVKRVNFTCSLSLYEIDTLTFLLAEYFNQQHLFNFDKLTFFNQFKYVIDVIKNDYEKKTESEAEVKQIFKLFVENDFIGQVPMFQIIMKNLLPYYKSIEKLENIQYCDNCATKSKLECLKCRATYMSEALSLLDESLQNGWEVFYRPMLGIPLLFFALFKSEFKEIDEDVFNVDNIVTNTLLQFFYNLLSDKATSCFWNMKKCNILIDNCRQYVIGLNDAEHLLINLNSHTYNTKLYTPLRQFVEKHFSLKQAGKLVHKIFIGFYLRIYLEAKKRNDARNKHKVNINVFNIEMRNVCRVLFRDYDNDEFENIIDKIEQIRNDLFIEMSDNYVTPKECVVRMFNKYNLKNDISKLLQKAVCVV
ncbi:ORF_69 [Adoxophyes orana granulovirus]|uniref:ORF_69 n=1 Tax=Adoxophyes orana granulovirus TaxID=170617 RepID=Q7T9U6_GVAO|nr:ORF_69 [Adoxophyes orana granulovirus]AAP85706.1 ORF_69 [Adoxophyes orana granulovirus]